MYPKIYILNSYVSTYWICGLLGIFFTVLLLNKLLLERLIIRKYILLYILSILGLIIGARFFGILSKLLDIYIHTGKLKIKNSITESGIVYLGGLFGYIGMLKFLCKFKNRKWNEISNITAIIIPFFHVFGRIGCFFGGCCYGVKSNCFLSLPYRTVLENNYLENRIPVQLIEAGMEFLIFILFYFWYKQKLKQKKESDNKMLTCYLLTYSIGRFIIEFYRGDKIRGTFEWISFSQIIAILLLIISFKDIFYKWRKDK